MTDKTVLIVEDEDNFAHALDIVLSRHGYLTRRAADGTSALAALTDGSIDVVLLDILLPDRSGFEICQTLRQTQGSHDIKVIMMSARGGHAERRKGLALGADAFLSKPFPTSDMIHEIDSLTGKDRDA
ncbi:MAG TPA: response regulator [Roseovarius sp.]|nr:response regulator [Roseovarius sp.]